MTTEDVRSELEKEPFIPLRLHLVSGAGVDIPDVNSPFMLQNAVMVLHDSARDPEGVGRYDVLSLRNIERIEQLPPST